MYFFAAETDQQKKLLSQIHETMDRTAHVSRMVYAAFEFKIILARFLIF